MNYKEVVESLLPVAKEAGEKIMSIYESDFEVEYKEDQSPLTQADFLSNELIVKFLKNNYADCAVLSEEETNDDEKLDNSYCFVVDPLDGTKEFVKRNGEFTVNIALCKDHKVVLGVIYVPVRREMYYAYKDGGAYYKGSQMKNFTKIKVSQKKEKLRLVMSRSHASAQLENLINQHRTLISDIKRAGSSLKGCLVAKGEAEIYFRFNPTMEWDTAAMQIIVEEAGGIFKQLDNSEMTYNREDHTNRKGFYVVNRLDNVLTDR